MKIIISNNSASCSYVLAIIISFAVVSNAAAEVKTVNEADYTAFSCGKAPVIDGKLDDQCWRGAFTLNMFYLNDGKRSLSPQKNEVAISYDEKYIYVAGRCEEGKMELLSNLSPGRDKPNWEDDRLEVFFDAKGNGRGPSHYISINSFGITSESHIDIGEWDPEIIVGVGRENRAWTLEFAVPISSFGRMQARGQQWGINIGRHHRGSFKASSSLVPLEGRFNQPAKFAKLTFAPKSFENNEVISKSRGDMSRIGGVLGTNSAVYQIENKSAERELEFIVENRVGEKTVLSQSVRRKVSNGGNAVEQNYTVLGEKGEELAFMVKDENGTVLFISENRLAVIQPFFRVFDTEDPLFESLLKNGTPKNTRLNGNIIWGMCYGGFLPAIQGAFPFSYDSIKKETSDMGMHLLCQYAKPLPFIHPDSFVLREDNRKGLPTYCDENRKNGWGGIIFYPPYYLVCKDEAGRPAARVGMTGILADPINLHGYIQSVKATLDEYGKDFWAVYSGEEQHAGQNAALNRFFKQEYDPAKPEHAAFKRIEEEVKRDYGFNRFGLPQRMNVNDPDYPYCLRAYETWLIDKLRFANRELRKAVKEKFPDMPLIHNSHGGALVDIEHTSEFADMLAIQTQINLDPLGQGYAYQAKLAKDISGLDYLLACPHDLVAGFPTGDLGPDEMRELYSQLFRCGVTGFHTWPWSYGAKDPIPPIAFSVTLGYPLAWRYHKEAVYLAREMPILATPKADAAIFVSAESAKCGYGGANASVLFNVLGPHARGWFRFLSEGTLDLGRAQLSDYGILYLAGMKYARRDIAEQIVKYCESGGVVVCCDPQIFANEINSTPLTELREKLFGIKVVKECPEARKIIFSAPLVEGICELAVDQEKSKSWAVELAGANAKTLATFDNGTPAIVENRIGKGRAIYFAWTPFNSGTLKCEGWVKFLIGQYRLFGGKTGHDIWRFTIPKVSEDGTKKPDGVCLTGNYAFWDYYKFIEGKQFNRETGGEYTIVTDGRELHRPFTVGQLTNRLLLATKYTPGSIHPALWHKNFNKGDWAEEFKDTAPATITFDFKQAYEFSRLTVFFYGELPVSTIEVSIDGRTWNSAGNTSDTRSTGEKEVAMIKMDIPSPGKNRYLRISIPERGKELSLVEIEVWANGGK